MPGLASMNRSTPSINAACTFILVYARAISTWFAELHKHSTDISVFGSNEPRAHPASTCRRVEPHHVASSLYAGDSRQS